MKMSKIHNEHWEPSFAGNVCIGVQTVGFYGQMICNSILPDNDQDYKNEEADIIAKMRLMASAPELLVALLAAKEEILASYRLLEIDNPERGYGIDGVLTKVDAAISKATKVVS